MGYELKQPWSLFKALTKNENGVLYGENNLPKNLIKKVKKQNYEIDQAFFKTFLTVENENVIKKVEIAPLTTN